MPSSGDGGSLLILQARLNFMAEELNIFGNVLEKKTEILVFVTGLVCMRVFHATVPGDN